MPVLGKPARPRRGRVVLVIVLVAAAGSAGLYGYQRLRARAAAAPATVATTTMTTPPSPSPVEEPREPAVPDAIARAGLRHAGVVVAGPLETALVRRVGRPVGLPLAQVVARSLAWWVSMPVDLRRGDTVDVLFEERPGAEPSVVALRLRSGKTGRAYRAYRFRSTGASHGRLYEADGLELEPRLRDAPVDDYEQITSLLRDGRGHSGVDFKTPVGTPVKAPFDGVVSRRGWNPRLNGNALEIREIGGAGRRVDFLHLAEVAPELRAGERVARGQVVARSGNTGRSYAPHLHYQLMSSAGVVLDPFVVQETSRRPVPPAQRAIFDAEVARLDGLLALVEKARM